MTDLIARIEAGEGDNAAALAAPVGDVEELAHQLAALRDRLMMVESRRSDAGLLDKAVAALRQVDDGK